MSWSSLQPGPDAVHVGELVAYEWTTEGHWLHRSHDGPCQQDIDHLYVWHDCGKLLGPESVAPGERYGWCPAGVGAHTLVQVEPLTITASVYWPACCGLHGFITDGVWRGV
jgi:hypothetical protein